MKMPGKVTTQVFQLPSDVADRSRFLEGIRTLAAECKAEWLSGSVHNEIAYADLLEKELGEHVGAAGVEDIRQRFERK